MWHTKNRHFAYAFFSAYILYFLLSPLAAAFSFFVSTDASSYVINDTMNINITADTNMNGTNVSLFLMSTSDTRYNQNTSAVNISANISMKANVSTGGDHLLKVNFTFNSTYYESTILLKISKASTFVISTDKSTYGPGESINFTVKATDKNNAGVSGESINVEMVYQSNDTRITNYSGTTNTAGEFSNQLTAPSVTGTYRLIVNHWLAIKIFDVSAFEMVAYAGDVNGNAKLAYGINDTAYIYIDLFSTNKTKYTNTETISVNITYPNATVISNTYTYSGSRINTSLLLTQSGTYKSRVQASSITKYIDLTFNAQENELRGALESSTRGSTNTFFPNETITVIAKVYNVSTGEAIAIDYSGNGNVWNLTIFDSDLKLINNPSNSTNKTSSNEYRFNFTAPSTTGLYYAKITLNQTNYTLDFNVKDTFAETRPVDQDYKFKNVFVGNKQTIRVLTTLTNNNTAVNVTNISVLEVRKAGGANIKSALTINETVIDYEGKKAGLVSFAAPQDAGWYFIRVLANNNYGGDSQFMIKLYSVCSQLADYRWFISSNESAALTLKVTEAKDIGIVESSAGNLTSSSTNSSSFDSMYGMKDCYGTAHTGASGSSTAGNATSNIVVTVAKVINIQTFEDLTTKLSILPSNTTDDNGKVVLNITAPTNGWDSGSYIVEFTLRDKNNNTDKGYGWFNVKNLWINVWPKQYSGYWKWYFSPNETATLNVYSYNSTATWNWYGDSRGVGDYCSVAGIFYQGDGSQWFWPPKAVSNTTYNWTCTNSSNPAKGQFDLNITPNTPFKTGYYMVKVKVNNTAGTLSDTGDGWLTIKAYNVYVKTASSNYYDSWYKTPTDNLTFKVDIAKSSSTQFSCYWSSCPDSERVTEKLNVTVKKITKYDQWQPKDYSPTKYDANVSNGTSYANISINTTNGTVTITLTPKGGTNNNSWETGSYSLVVEVNGSNGTETANSWYEVRSFFVDIQPTNANGTTYKSAFKSNENLSFNVTTASKPKWMSTSHGVNITQYNTTITKAKLSYYSPSDYKMTEIPVNFTPIYVNGSAVVNITPTSSLVGGNWYNFEMTLRDANGNEQTGYTSFQIKDFTVGAQTEGWKWEYSSNETINITAMVCDSDKYWCSSPNTYTGSDVNLSISNVYKTNSWPYTTITGWTATSGQATSSNSGTATLSLTPGASLSSGYYSAEVSATYASGSGATQKQNVWFQIKSFTFRAEPTTWEFAMKDNVTIKITSNKALTLSSGSLNCGYWPDTKTFTLGSNLAANTTTISSGTTYIKLSTSGTTWTNGYCSGTLTATDGTGTENSYVSFNIKAFTLQTSMSKYNFDKNQSINITLTTDSGQQVNITNVTLTNWDVSPPTQYSTNNGFSTNATSITSSGTLTLTPTGDVWPEFGYYSGEITATDSSNANVKQKAWFSFNVPAPLSAWGYPVDKAGNYLGTNTSSASKNVTFKLTVQKYNSGSGYYQTGTNVAASLLKIEKENCATYPCSYTELSGYTITNNATSNSNGVALVNVSKEELWSYGSYRAIFKLNDSALVVNTTRIGFWVSNG